MILGGYLRYLHTQAQATSLWQTLTIAMHANRDDLNEDQPSEFDTDTIFGHARQLLPDSQILERVWYFVSKMMSEISTNSDSR